MVGLQRGLLSESLNDFESGRGTEGHRDSNGAIEFDDRRWRVFEELLVKRRDARPVGVRSDSCSRVTCGDGGLQGVRSGCAAELLGTLQRSEAAGDEQLIPSRTVLFEQ